MICLFLHRLLTRSRVEDYSDGLDPTAADFRAMLRRLARRHTFVSSAELAATLADGRTPDPRWLHLSFDDGFASTLVAAEICAAEGVPLTVFVCSRVLDGFVPWFVTMRHALASARRPLTLDGLTLDPRDPRQALHLNRLVKAEVYASSAPAETAVLEVLARLGCGDLPPLPAKHRFLDRRELARVVDLGAEVGGHGATHCSLRGLAPDRLREEVVDARAALVAACGREPVSFSYPEGLFDDAAKAAVRDAGYAVAFAVEDGAVARDCYALPRRWLGRNLDGVGRPLAAPLFTLWGRAKSRLARVG